MTVTAEHFECLTIDRDAIEVRLNGDVISLTKTEFLLLDALSRNPRRAMTNQELFRAIWGSEWVDDGALQTQISRLRGKLGESGSSPRMIVTVHGFGYRFEPHVGSSPLEESVDRTTEASLGPVGFALVTRDREFRWVGGQWEQLLGFSPDDLVGTALYDCLHPEDKRFAVAARMELDAGIPAAIRFRMRTSTGGYRGVEVLERPILRSDGSIDAFLGEFKATSHCDFGTISHCRLPHLHRIDLAAGS